MAVAEKTPKIYSAIAAVMHDISAVSKQKEFKSKYGGYKFRGIDDVMNALHPAMVKNKVFVVPVILEQTRELKTAQSGNQMIMSICKIRYEFYAEDGSCVSAIVIGEGMDTGDKATNKAMSIAFKYACFQVFCIPTEEMDDPDGERPELDGNNAGKKQPEAGKTQGATSNPKQAANKGQESKTGQEKQPEKEVEGSGIITEAMLKTIRSEQMRTGVSDAQIIGMKKVTAKKIEEMTIGEFNVVMSKFEITPDLKKGDA